MINSRKFQKLERVRLFIAEGNLLIREGLSRLFLREQRVELVGAVEATDDLMKLIFKTRPDVLLIDYQSGDFTNTDLMSILRVTPDLKVIGITNGCDVQEARRFLAAGMHGHILHDCDHSEVIDSVVCCARGDKFFCGKVLEKLNSVAEAEPSKGCDPVNISERELEILNLVAEGLTTKQIAERLHLSFHTVMTHRKNMMNKLGINNTAGLIIYAVKENLISPNKFLFSTP